MADYVIVLIGVAIGVVLLSVIVAGAVLAPLRRFARARASATAALTTRVGKLTETMDSRRVRDENLGHVTVRPGRDGSAGCAAA